MPIIDPKMRKAIEEQFGPNFTIDSTNLERFLEVVVKPGGGITDPGGPVQDPYDKWYTRGYDKEDYVKSDYSQYDKVSNRDRSESVINPAILQQIFNQMAPALDKAILEKVVKPVVATTISPSPTPTPVAPAPVAKREARALEGTTTTETTRAGEDLGAHGIFSGKK